MKKIVYILISILLISVFACGCESEPEFSDNELAQREISKGNVYLEGANFDYAANSFEKAIEYDPSFADAYLILSDTYENMGEIEKSQDALKRGLTATNDERIQTRLDEIDKLAEAKALEEEKKREEEFKLSEDLTTVTLGGYEQDNNLQNGTESIEWIVLDKQGDKALVISTKILDCKPYNEGFKDATWENSSIRKWLNNDFYQNAFTDGERERIKETTVSAAGNSEYTVDGGVETTDKIFLLSYEELLQYCTNDETSSLKEGVRRAEVSEYAKAQGVWTMTQELYDTYNHDEIENSDPEAEPEIENDYSIGCGWWWLRNVGGKTSKAMDVKSDGTVRTYGHLNGEGNIGVRPAMWININ